MCPDAAIPNTVHELHTLLLTTIDTLEIPEAQRAVLRTQVHPLAEGVREAFRADKDATAFHLAVASVGAGLSVDNALWARSLNALIDELATFPVARTRPYFDAMEKSQPGSGGLFSAVIDPWKCTGCLECTDVCGPGALTPVDQDDALLDTLQARFELLSALPNTPGRFYEGSTSPEGDLKRLLLDHDNYYATTGGHGACRGCGEVTAIRLVMSMSHALGEERRAAHEKTLVEVLAGLEDKLASLGDADTERKERLTRLVTALERRLYLVESGPTGDGPSTTVVANSTGCSSVYASTVPFNNYLDPWVNSLFQDAQPLAKGIFEGYAHDVVDEVRALRAARLEIDDAYDATRHEPVLQRLTWERLTPDELDLMPTIMTIGGDGANYDIGFGAMSRVLASETPIKVMVLNSGAYSNTGGQASTASFTGQDSDLSRFGGAHDGKHESRKELGLLASFHPNVYVASTSTSIHGHFLKCSMDFLSYADGPAVMDTYTPCGSEHGFAEAASAARSRLAVESRMSPLFVHDPRRGKTLHDWFNLDGNPDPDATWTTTTLEYVDEAGQLQLMTTPLTPAEFALGETRFKKQFRKLAAADEERAVPIDEFVELERPAREGKVPFIYATDDDRHLIKVQCSGAVVALVEDRRRYWQILQYLSGQHEAALTALHGEDLATITARYDEAMTLRESSLDEIARAMADLATSSRAPAGMSAPAPVRGAAAPSPAAAPAATAVADRAVWLDPADEAKCTDCGTCYQELPMFFEKVTAVVDGAARTVARFREGSLEKNPVTPALQARIDRVKATCDA
ncbi:MAG TPA: pyruvate-flavodoxin oxidoreductase, partial [Actinotalea sp.]|nr:pyruvate-flavodoxin oxidoreductase [Actinotalea sp.]